MNDIVADFRALPILDRDREQYHAAVRSFQAHWVTDTRRRLRMWFWLCIASLVIVGMLAASLTAALPLKTAVPMFLVVRDDGTVDTGVSIGDLGVDMAQKVIRASIWRYVSERESYSYSEARYRYDLVSLMSGQEVQRAYQQWFLTAEDSPNKKILKKGQISVREISMSPVRDGVFLVRFWKITQMVGEKEEKISVTATVEYELLHQAPASLILDDPAALRVVRYQLEENSA
jgi:type IV secretion system protein VirB8